MPLYQNSTVDKNKLVLGNYTLQVATYTSSIGATFTNLGAGIVNSFSHNLTKYDVQAGNAPDPVEGVSEETFTIEGELIEYDASKLGFLYSGLSTTSGSGLDSLLTFGGKTELTDLAFKFTNTRRFTGTTGTALTATTTIFVPKATAETGLAFTAKSDNDSDPINVMAFSVTGKIDATLTVGSQLVTIKRVIGAA
jgi:hypothetical protein